MKKITLSLAASAAVLVAGLATPPAHAQLMRTFVSAAGGNDANDCSFATPCRSFQGAHDKTLDQGEITVLAAGGYGGVTITKSISIVNDGVGEASILVSGGATGININGGPTTVVNLRGITVQGIGFGGGGGLDFNKGSGLTITKCVFRNLSFDGIHFLPTVDGAYNLAISDTLVADNGGAAGILILNSRTNSTIRAVLDGVRTLNNSFNGIYIHGRDGHGGSLDVTVTDSMSANNGKGGFRIESLPTGVPTGVSLVHSVIANNSDTGLLADTGVAAGVRLGHSVIAGNGFAWNGSLSLRSFGDNYIAGNLGGETAPPLIASK